eukprot:837566-Rhodomonas_salina.1
MAGLDLRLVFHACAGRCTVQGTRIGDLTRSRFQMTKSNHYTTFRRYEESLYKWSTAAPMCTRACGFSTKRHKVVPRFGLQYKAAVQTSDLGCHKPLGKLSKESCANSGGVVEPEL